MRILVVDDHTLVRRGMMGLLEHAAPNTRVDEAAGGDEALAKVATGAYDAVVLDITMPGRDGMEVLCELQKRHPKLPVLMVSMHQEDLYAVRAMRAGAAGYLTKDCVPEELCAAVRTIAAGGKHVTAAVGERLAAVADSGAAAGLSAREQQVLRQLVAGDTLTEIAAELSLSVKTIHTYQQRLMAKTGTKSQAGLVRYALQHGFESCL